MSVLTSYRSHIGLRHGISHIGQSNQSHTMEHSEQVKNMEKLISIYKQCSHLSLKDSKAVAYTLEKTLRIASVTLKLTSFMESGNTIREDIERTAMGLVKDAASFAHSDRSRRSFEAGVATLSALLTTASYVGLVSVKNVMVLNDELSALITTTANIGTLSGRTYMEADAFSVELPQELFMSEPKGSMPSYKGHVTDDVRTARPSMQAPRVERPYQTSSTPEAQRPPRYAERVQEVQKDRRATILGLLQRKDRITVKDVANVVRDCSEKTIQRELAALVSQGVLKREGERRWSTYSLV